MNLDYTSGITFKNPEFLPNQVLTNKRTLVIKVKGHPVGQPTESSKKRIIKKRKPKPSITTNAPIAKKVKVGKEPIEVKVVDWNEFLKGLPNMKSGTPQEKILELKKYCTSIKELDSPPAWQLYIQFPTQADQAELWLTLLIEDKNYDSTAVSEMGMEELQKNSQTEQYTFISLYEHENEEVPLFQIRTNPQGNMGELLYVGSNKKISGNTLFQLYGSILDYLKIEKVIVNDNSHIKCADTEVAFRMFDAIVDKTWYEKQGFEPLTCENLETVEKSILKNQSLNDYKKSQEFLRQVSIFSICRALRDQEQSTKSKILVDAWGKTLAKSANPKAFNRTTFADLLKNVSLAQRNNRGDSLYEQIYINVFNNFLNFEDNKHDPLDDSMQLEDSEKSVLTKLDEALEEIWNTSFLVKKYV